MKPVPKQTSSEPVRSPEQREPPHKSANQLWAALSVSDLATPPDSPGAATVRELIVDVVAGEPSAVKKFTELMYPAICKLAGMGANRIWDIINPHADNRDLSQWAWLYLVQGLRVNHKFEYNRNTLPLSKWLSDPQVSLSSYVAAVVRQYLRDCGRTVFRSGVAATVPLLEQGLSVEGDTGITSDLRLRISECWPKLTSRERDVLSLRFYEDLSLKQVAQVLGRSPSTIQRWEQGALKSLESFLA